MSRAAIYVRLSKEDRQGKAQGVESCGVQLANAGEAIARQGWILDDRHVFTDDGISGTEILRRPGLQAILAGAARGEFDVIVVRDLDRFARCEPARTMGLLQDLADVGVRLWCYVERAFVRLDGVDVIVTTVRAAQAAGEADKASTRIREGLLHRARDGRAVHKPPFGYRIISDGDRGKRWEIDPERAAIVRHVGEVAIATGSISAAASKLNAEGLRAPHGGTWRHTMVAAILDRSLYRGFYLHGGTVIEKRAGTSVRRRTPEQALRVEHPALAIWTQKQLVQIDALRARPTRPWGTAPRHLSSPFVRCGFCGGSIVATSSTRSLSASYVCDRQRLRGCAGIGYRAEGAVDAAVIRAAASLLTDDVVDRTCALIRERLKETGDESDERDHLQREIASIERRVSNLTDAVAEASAGSERTPLMARLRGESERLRSLQAALERAEAGPIKLDGRRLLAQVQDRARTLRADLGKGGIAALPAVRTVLGASKLRAYRVLVAGEKRWTLAGRVNAGFLFAESDSQQKKAVHGTAPTANSGTAPAPGTAPLKS